MTAAGYTPSVEELADAYRFVKGLHDADVPGFEAENAAEFPRGIKGVQDARDEQVAAWLEGRAQCVDANWKAALLGAAKSIRAGDTGAEASIGI